MKLFSLVLIIGILLPSIIYSQDNSIPEFNKIKTPTSPAFVLLGVEPTSVARPNTPAAFALEVLNKSENFSVIPKDYALELSPYWLFGHPSLTWQQDTARNIFNSILRTGTISIATADIGDTLPVTGLSFGIRFSILSGKMSEQSIENLQSLDSLLGGQASIFNRHLNKKIIALDQKKEQELQEANDDPIIINAIIEKYSLVEDSIKHAVIVDPDYLQEVENLKSVHQDFAAARNGFFLETAAGFLFEAPDAIIDSTEFKRFGVWITPSYQANNWSIVGVARYLKNENSFAEDNYDFGIRGIYYDKSFAVSLEYVTRIFNNSDLKNQNRLVGNIEYNIWDNTWLQATFGKDFSGMSKGSLLTQLGISFNFSNKRYELPE